MEPRPLLRRLLAALVLSGLAASAMAELVLQHAPVLATEPVVQTVAVPRQVCHSELRCGTTTFYENRTVGYRVTYLYEGREYTVQLPYEPGPTLTLQQDAALLGQPGAAPPTVVVAPAPVVVAPPAVVYHSYIYQPWYGPAYAYPYPSAQLYLRFGGGHPHRRHHHRYPR
ncbi:MAG: hypothetical protein VW687_02495 [Curvibacter sp.]